MMQDYQDTYVSVIGRVAKVIDNKTFVMQTFKDDDGVPAIVKYKVPSAGSHVSAIAFKTS